MFFLILFLNLSKISDQPIILNLNQNKAVVFQEEDFVKNRESFLLIEQNNISAEVILIKELNGKTLFAKNTFISKPIASLTKLMSAYIAYLIYKPDDIFIFDEESINQEGQVGNFYIGEPISRDQALQASLVASSNDAIYLLAKKNYLKNFVSLMNQKAKEFKMNNTYFVDPTGVSKDNKASAYDLYLLTEKIYSLAPEIFNLTTLEKITINGKILWTTNLLLPKYKNIFVGAKTGFTYEAGECFLMILKFEKSPFINVILLNSKDRFSDAEKIIKALKVYYGG